MLKTYLRIISFFKLIPQVVKQRNFLIAIVCFLILASGTTNYVLGNKQQKRSTTRLINSSPTVKPTLSVSPSTTPAVSQTDSQTKNNQKVTSTPTLTKTSPTLTATLTSAPTRVSNPPIINISYPSENQSITFTSSSQAFCVVDTPTGGNTSGILRRQNISNQGWSNYAAESTLCFQPGNGSNTFSVQYKNVNGDESSIYTRNFTFGLQQNITVSLHGELYSDTNCNNSMESGESGIPNVSITIMQPDGLILSNATTDSNGSYSFSKDIAQNASLTLVPEPNDHAYIFQVPSPVTLNVSNTSVTLNLSHCP